MRYNATHDSSRDRSHRSQRPRSSPLIHGKATIDEGRKAVTVMSGDTHQGTWSGVTCSTALDVIAQGGWRAKPGAKWVVSPPDNGFVIDVVKG